MFDKLRSYSSKDWEKIFLDVFLYLCRKWYVLLAATVIFTGIGYTIRPASKITYTSTISFVLTTETKSNGFSGLAAQFGLEAGTGGNDNVFAGDNILELFKSRKMITYTLLHSIGDKDTSLLNFIAPRLFPDDAKKAGKCPDDVAKFNEAQRILFNKAVPYVSNSFVVFKKDKRLIFYLISATSGSADVAYYIAKNMLDQTSKFFIDTKTKVATRSLELLQRESDSLGILLGGMYEATARMNDRSFNMNPSILVQRSGAQFNQARSAAISAAYTEVLRNLEIAKINIQKETPLFQIIDEPQLPLWPQRSNMNKYIYYSGILGFALSLLILTFLRLNNKIFKRTING